MSAGAMDRGAERAIEWDCGQVLLRFYDDVRPERIAVVFDSGRDSFRKQVYPEYKANRSPMPDDLTRQIEPIHEAVRLLGWPVLEVPGIEADDAIGTIAN